jgi:hypothetical protein
MSLQSLIAAGAQRLGHDNPTVLLADAALRYGSTSAHNARAQGLAEQLLLEALMSAAGADPETRERAADAGESIDEYLCGIYRGHAFPAWEEIGESSRCLCACCGKDGDA